MPAVKRRASTRKESELTGFGGEYLDLIKERKKISKAYKKHQFIGLELAEILDDPGHKSFYIKLAKEENPEELLSLAKDVASRKGVRNKGAYFMRLWHDK